MKRYAWCAFVLVSMLGCTSPRPPTFVEIEGEAGPVREWAPEDASGALAELPFYRVSRHMDACTPEMESTAAAAMLNPLDLDLDPPEAAGSSEVILQLECAEGRLLRSFTWYGGRSASEEPCGGAPVSLGEWRPSLIYATDDDIGTYAIHTTDDPTCAEISVCRPIPDPGVIERSEQIAVAICQAPGRTEMRPGAPAEAWGECLDALREGTDGDRCTFEGGCVGLRTVTVDWGSGPREEEKQLLVWCGGGLARFASMVGVGV